MTSSGLTQTQKGSLNARARDIWGEKTKGKKREGRDERGAETGEGRDERRAERGEGRDERREERGEETRGEESGERREERAEKDIGYEEERQRSDSAFVDCGGAIIVFCQLGHEEEQVEPVRRGRRCPASHRGQNTKQLLHGFRVPPTR